MPSTARRTGSSPFSRNLLLVLLLASAAIAGWRWIHVDEPPASPATTQAERKPAPQPVPTSGQPPAVEAGSVPKTASDEGTDQDKQLPTAFRASPSQRAEDARRLREDTDLAALASELMERAKAGDQDAAQAMVDLLRHCATANQYAAEDSDHWAYLRVVAALGDAEIQVIAEAMRTEQSRCSGLGASDSERMYDQSFRWMAIAARLGAPGSLVELPRQGLRTPESRAAHARMQREAFLQMFEDSPDPDLLARHMNTLAPVTGLRSEAFVLAACNFRPACAADPTGYPMHLIASGTDTGRWTEFMQLRMLTPRDRMLVEGQARFILELWNAGRYADLLAPQNALAPGWK